MGSTACLSENIIAALVGGHLRGEASEAAARHIDRCEACRALVAALAPTAPTGADHAPPAPLIHLLPSAAPAWTPPTEFAEYIIRAPLGQGATGQVYVAQDRLLDRLVAIKFIPSAREQGGTQGQRFFTEARAIARLQHPNIVTLYQVGEVEGRRYLVSEYVRGKSLVELERPVPWERVLSIGLGLSRGLAVVHAKGILHRDIKPANAILAETGEAKLLDFGLAKLLDEHAAPLPPAAGAEDPPSLSRTGAIIGTPLYLPPELWQGQPATCRSDVYALGALLFELCAGRPPRTAATIGDLRAQMSDGDPPALIELAPGVDAFFAAAIDRCLRRDPVARFASGEDLYGALEEIHVRRAAVPLAEGNPYRGLEAFEREHQGLFFGRTNDVLAVIERLKRKGPLLAVVGESGVGKSSLCRAGVLPAIEGGALGEGRRWGSVTLSLGRRPLRALAHGVAPLLRVEADELYVDLRERPGALARLLPQRLGAKEGVVLFIDQFEELLTQPGADAEREVAAVGAALGHLHGQLPGVRVLLTLRTDFLARLAAVPELGRGIEQALYLLRPLTDKGLRQAIEEPARRMGFAFDTPRTVEQFVTAAREAKGALPLLQFALAELWMERDRKRSLLSDAALAKIGGVTGALAKHADRILEDLPAQERAAARDVLVQLVHVDGTRARLTEAELGLSDPRAKGAVEALVRGRLLVAEEAEGGGTCYQIAHEALVQGWGTLGAWLRGDAERRQMLERLRIASAEWIRLGRGRDGLWGKRQLADQAAGVAAADLPEQSAAFLRASRERLRALARRRWLFGLGLGGALAASAAALVWERQRTAAERQRTAAQEREVEMMEFAQRPGAEWAVLQRATEAVGDALQGDREPPSFGLNLMAGMLARLAPGVALPGHRGPVELALFAPREPVALTVNRDGIAWLWRLGPVTPARRLVGHRDAVMQAYVSPDGRWLASVSKDHQACLWDVLAGSQVGVMKGHGGTIRSGAFSHRGDHFVTTSDDRTAIVWSVPDARQQVVLRGHEGKVRDAHFSSDDALIVTGSDDGTARIWDSASGTERARLSGHEGFVWHATFSPDDRRVLTSGTHGAARIYDLQSGERVHVLAGHEDTIMNSTFSRTGRYAVTASDDRTARVWDAATGKERFVLRGHRAGLNGAKFTAEDRRLVTVGDDATARIWDLATGRELYTLSHEGVIKAVELSSSGRLVATGGDDRVVRIWDTETGQLSQTLAGHSDTIYSVVFFDQDRRLASAGMDGTIRLWDVAEPPRLLRGHEAPIWSAAFSPDGRRLVTASHDRTARLWDTRSGDAIAVLRGHRAVLFGSAFSPDSRWLVTTSYDHTARLWDASSGDPGPTLTGHREVVRWAAFSPVPGDGRLITASDDGTAAIWSSATGRRLQELRGHDKAVYWAAFSPDGKTAVTGGLDRRVILWDADSGARQRVLGAHDGDVTMGAFAPRGDLLATASRDGSVRIWGLQRPARTAALRGHTSAVLALAFAPDGRRLVTGSQDAVHVWDLDTGRSLLATDGQAYRAGAVSVSPDGRSFLMARRDTALVLPLTPRDLLGIGCKLLLAEGRTPEMKRACQGVAAP